MGPLWSILDPRGLYRNLGDHTWPEVQYIGPYVTLKTFQDPGGPKGTLGTKGTLGIKGTIRYTGGP